MQNTRRALKRGKRALTERTTGREPVPGKAMVLYLARTHAMPPATPENVERRVRQRKEIGSIVPRIRCLSADLTSSKTTSIRGCVNYFNAPLRLRFQSMQFAFYCDAVTRLRRDGCEDSIKGIARTEHCRGPCNSCMMIRGRWRCSASLSQLSYRSLTLAIDE